MTRTVSVSPGIDHPVAWPSVACTADPDLFFSLDRKQVHAAQRMCAQCPMLQRCAAYTLASPQLPTDGVFASVRMPVSGALPEVRAHAIAQLKRVARTGKPAELHDFTPRRFEGTAEELRAAVVKLRDIEGLSWSSIGYQLGCNYLTAQHAYIAATGSEAVA